MRDRGNVLAFAVALLVLSGLCIAAVTNTPVFVQLPKVMVIALPTTGRTPQALGPTPGANGTKCTGLFATNTDASNAYAVQISMNRSSTNYQWTTVNVPLSSGNTTAALPINLMSSAVWPGLPVDSDGNPYFMLLSGDQLQANTAAATTTANAVTVTAFCADF